MKKYSAEEQARIDYAERLNARVAKSNLTKDDFESAWNTIHERRKVNAEEKLNGKYDGYFIQEGVLDEEFILEYADKFLLTPEDLFTEEEIMFKLLASVNGLLEKEESTVTYPYIFMLTMKAGYKPIDLVSMAIPYSSKDNFKNKFDLQREILNYTNSLSKIARDIEIGNKIQYKDLLELIVVKFRIDLDYNNKFI